jgi:hypothetical protein
MSNNLLIWRNGAFSFLDIKHPRLSKSKDQKTKPFNKTFNQTLTETMNTYDGTNYVYDGSDDIIMTEADMLKKFTAQEKYKLLKQVLTIKKRNNLEILRENIKKRSP